MTRTITAYFDDVTTAERAAHDLARQVPGVRGAVFDARSDSKSIAGLSVPAEDAAVLSEGFRRGGGVVHRLQERAAEADRLSASAAQRSAESRTGPVPNSTMTDSVGGFTTPQEIGAPVTPAPTPPRF